ncbi:rhodanese-like domain-containing protein [Thermus thermamylovorans]|uniref:Rhodanese-like domain-containing protein n=1 Tax=Thermus thermamylovorans TaxID=2509362 RepID=A0A4Q9B3W8_9DEIN|nr:rhodanese-like domain-containing protein [Thermus thermamylovorans]TBH20088.1 rhodanese-like domain-containing protein [Thermus thermamylovorans]
MYETQVKDLTPEEAKRLYDQGAAFVDVREVEEYAQARIPQAQLIPLSEFAARYGEIPKDRPVVLYCRTGNRSWQAAAWLAAQGYGNVYNLDGGIVRWYRSGLPVDTAPVEAGYGAAPFQEVGPLEARRLLEEAFVVDVREPWEYGEGHVPGAVNIPLSTLPARLAELPKDRPILLVCNSGNRSGVAADFLVSQGFPGERVYNLEGGTYAWLGAGLPVER